MTHSRRLSLCLQRTFRCLALVLVTAGLVSAPKSGGWRLRLPAATQPDVTPPVYEFTVKNEWLPMKDGVRLSVTFLKPAPRSPGETFPVLLDLYPYRKDESPRAAFLLRAARLHHGDGGHPWDRFLRGRRATA